VTLEILAKTPSTEGPAERFTGEVRCDVICAGQEPFGAGTVPDEGEHRPLRARRAQRVAPACGGRTIHVTEGVGLVLSPGDQIVVIRPGTRSTRRRASGTGTAQIRTTS
jgi:hypothetical protein